MDKQQQIERAVEQLREQGFHVEVVGDNLVISKGGQTKTVAISDFLSPKQPIG